MSSTFIVGVGTYIFGDLLMTITKPIHYITHLHKDGGNPLCGNYDYSPDNHRFDILVSYYLTTPIEEQLQETIDCAAFEGDHIITHEFCKECIAKLDPFDILDYCI